MSSSIFNGKTIVIGVTGSIACYKTLELIKELKRQNANVFTIVTENAKSLIDVKDFEKASGNEVYTALFHPKINYAEYIKKNKKINHISLADIAGLFLICPATANIIGKIANGIADDLIATSVMATAAPVLICPAMNVKMWKNPIVQENVKKLKNLDYHFVKPEYGELACGYTGVGRLADMNRILERIGLLLRKGSDLSGKKILVTAGATFEEIDAVRIITNKSSGKMGARIAEQAFLRGADVFLLRGINSVEPNYIIREEKFTTADDLHNKIKNRINDFDIVIHTAAVSDFTLNNKDNKNGDKKIKSDKPLHLEFEPAAKILEKLKKINNNIFLVGFKAEYKIGRNELIKSAYELLKSAGADMIVANDVGKENTGFDADTNEVLIVDEDKNVEHIGLADKRIVAEKILDSVVKHINMPKTNPAKSFAPANISCIFKIHSHKNPRWMGSYGVGFTVNEGVVVTAEFSGRRGVYFNNKKIDFPTVKYVVDALIKKLIEKSGGVADKRIAIKIESRLPLGCGFGLSGASALAAAYALNKLLKLKKPKKELAALAHIAEVKNKTGLGDVVNQYYGGFCLKEKPSSYFIIKRLPICNINAYCRYYSKLSTKSVISDKKLKNKINKAAGAALGRIKRSLKTNKKIGLKEVIGISKEFAVNSGLLRDKKTMATIKNIEKNMGNASMIMLGNAVFSDKPFNGAIKLKITGKAAYVI